MRESARKMVAIQWVVTVYRQHGKAPDDILFTDDGATLAAQLIRDGAYLVEVRQSLVKEEPSPLGEGKRD